MMNGNKFLVWFFLSVLVGLSASCGKVTQDVRAEKAVNHFTLTYSVPVIPTTDVKQSVSPSANATHLKPFVVNEDLYAAVSSYKNSGKRDELSWGKGIVEVEEKEIEIEPKATENVKAKKIKQLVFNSMAFNKRGIEIKSADHTWTFLKLNPEQKKWSIESKKVKKGSPYYLAVVYSSPQNYRLKWFDQERISVNTTVSLGEISFYDTFLTVLTMKQYEDVPFDEKSYSRFLKVFDIGFFNALKYQFPKNTVVEFSYENPRFSFDRSFETQLLTLFTLVQVDFKEAFIYLEKMKSHLLTKNARKILKKNIEALKKEIAQEQTSSLSSTDGPPVVEPGGGYSNI